MIYRATAKFKTDDIPAAVTPRAPGNVPFYVDNIWEWLRPAAYPSRRFSAFASPQPEQAADSAGCRLDQVYAVTLADNQPFCQIVACAQPQDAKFHSDIGRLKQAVMRGFPPEWFARPLADRGVEGALFLPCATRDEMEMVLRDTRVLNPDQIRQASTFWDDVRLFEPAKADVDIHPAGELFFEGRYRLQPMPGDR